MITLTIRETCVLLVGLMLSLICSTFGNAIGDFGELAAFILVPIVFCLIRAGRLSNLPMRGLSVSCRIFAQIFFALALICLLLFEMGVAMSAGAENMSAGIRFLVAGFGFAYIFLMVLANTYVRPALDVS